MAIAVADTFITGDRRWKPSNPPSGGWPEVEVLWDTEKDGTGGLSLVLNRGFLSHAEERRWKRGQKWIRKS